MEWTIRFFLDINNVTHGFLPGRALTYNIKADYIMLAF